jgi:dihydroorotase
MLKWEQVYLSLARLGKWLTDKYIHEIDEHLIDAIVEERMKHVTTATLKRELRPPVERRDPIILPNQKDVEHVVEGAPGHFAPLIVAAMMSGARQDKLVKAKRSRINHEFKTLTIEASPTS